MRAAVLTLSDKGSRGERADTSGPALVSFLRERGVDVVRTAIIADDLATIADTLRSWADDGTADLIVTTGGTGVSPRDVTPEATLQVAPRLLPGFGEAMRAASLRKTPHAMISRALAALRGSVLILNLPGSPKAAIENIEAIWPAVPHAIAKAAGDPADCAIPEGKQ